MGLATVRAGESCRPSPPAGEEQQTDTGYDRHIGHVEGRPMVGTDMEVEKIRDRTPPRSVEHVAERAADQESDSGADGPNVGAPEPHG